MNRWRKLLVLWLLCVTLPLQAMAALRTHCVPGTAASAMQSAISATDNGVAAVMALHQAMTMSGQGDAMPGMHHHDGDTSHDAAPPSMAHQDTSHDHASSGDTHSHHANCSACAACVVCTALPPSVAIRTPDAQPSTAIPFLRTSAASAVVDVPERPPKALAA